MLKLEDLASKYELNLILVFGSRVTGDVHPRSDTDVGIYGQHILSETEKIQLAYEFSNVFRTDDIDLVDLKTASPLLRKEVLKNYKILFQKDEMFLYQLELANIHEMKELEVLDQMRHERLEEFVR